MPRRRKPIVITSANKPDPELVAKAIGPLLPAFMAFLRRLDDARPSGRAAGSPRRPPRRK